MVGVAHEAVALQDVGKQALAPGDGGFLVHIGQACGLPHVFGGLDDEGGGVAIEAIGVRLEPPMGRFLKVECEGLEQPTRAQPYEAALAQVDVGLVGGGVLLADAAVQAVAGDDEVGVRKVFVARLGFKAQLNPQGFASRLQDVEQALAADAAEPMSRGTPPGPPALDSAFVSGLGGR